MQECLHESSEADRNAKLLTEKLERYRKARELKQLRKQGCFHKNDKAKSDTISEAKNGTVNLDAGMRSEQQVPDVPAGTLVDKLERYRSARELKLREEQALLDKNSDACPDAAMFTRTRQKVPEREASTLVDKLERYRKARELKARETQGRTGKQGSLQRTEGVFG